MISSEDLIEQARHLANKERGRPKDASLRRAVSTAYYALFHEICRTTANALARNAATWESYALAYRAVDHQAARKLFERARNTGSPEFRMLGARLGEIGADFIRLQEERHRADYDPRPFPHGRESVSEMIALAKDGASKLAEAPDEKKRALAILLIASKRK